MGKPIEVLLDIPDCLVTLQGGISLVEGNLTAATRDGQKWAVLV